MALRVGWWLVCVAWCCWWRLFGWCVVFCVACVCCVVVVVGVCGVWRGVAVCCGCVMRAVGVVVAGVCCVRSCVDGVCCLVLTVDC